MNRSGDLLEHLGSLEHALNGLNVDELKGLIRLLPDVTKPTRKAEIVAAIDSGLTGNALRELWGRLDKTRQLAVSEALHSLDGRSAHDNSRPSTGSAPRASGKASGMEASHRS